LSAAFVIGLAIPGDGTTAQATVKDKKQAKFAFTV